MQIHYIDLHFFLLLQLMHLSKRHDCALRLLVVLGYEKIVYYLSMTNTHQDDTYSCKHSFTSTTCVTLTQKLLKQHMFYMFSQQIKLPLSI
jgi:hypothetical protein